MNKRLNTTLSTLSSRVSKMFSGKEASKQDPNFSFNEEQLGALKHFVCEQDNLPRNPGLYGCNRWKSNTRLRSTSSNHF